MPRLVLGLLTLALVSAGCGLGHGEEAAEVRTSADLLRDVDTARIDMRLLTTVRRTSESPPPEAEFTRLEGAVDLASNQAQLVVAEPPDREGVPILFDGYELYLPRGGDLDGERPWANLDFARADFPDPTSDDREAGVEFPPISPVLLIRMLEGALAGGIEHVGEATVRGERLERYEARFSYETIADELPEPARRGFENMRAAMGYSAEFSEGEVWIGDDGYPRRIIYDFEQRVNRRDLFVLRVTLDLLEVGGDVEVSVPSADELLGDDLRAYRQLWGEFQRG